MAATSEDDPVQLAAKLPLHERAVHKHWKVREAAYLELTDKFNVAEEDAKIYSEFASQMGKIARDITAPAQLVGFDTISKFADTAPPQLVRRIATDVVKGIVQKGLPGRPLNKAKAVDTFLMFVFADAGDLAIEVFVNIGFVHKTPKVVTAAVEAVTQALDTFGVKAMPVKTVVGKIPPLLNHSQEPVRNAAKVLVIKLHRWVGNAINSVLKSAKDVTVKEIEAAFEKNAKQPRPKPVKLTRAMEKRERNRPGGPQGPEDDGFGQAAQEEEEIDIAEEINLLEKMSKWRLEEEDGEKSVSKDFFGALDSKKWSSRKSALDAAIATIGEAKLIPVSYQEVYTRIRKILGKDANVNVVAAAAKLVSAMAAGLKKRFPPQIARHLLLDLFARLKEKNRIVLQAVCDALDSLHRKKCVKVVDLLEEITAAGSHKVPKARAELILWVARCLRIGIAGVDLKGAPLKCFGTLFITATEDSAPEVRDAALQGLASLQLLVGERNIAKFTDKLDKPRTEKIASILKDLRPIPEDKPSPEKAKPAGSPTGKDGKSPTAKREATGAKSSPAKRAPPKKPVIVESDDEGEASCTPEDALTKAGELFEGFEAETWSVKSFKARATAATIVKDAMSEKEGLSPDDVSIILGLLSCEPGLGDSNFLAAKPKMELFGLVAEKCPSSPPRKPLKPLLMCSFEKLGDMKLAKIAAGVLISFAEVTSPRFFLEVLRDTLKETKNSRAAIGMLKMAATIVEDFGVPLCPTKPIVTIVSMYIANPAPAAKNAALGLAGKAACRVGVDAFRPLLEGEGVESEGLEAFDAEMSKYSREPDPPTRKKKFGQTVEEGPTEEDNEEEPEVAEPAAPEEEVKLPPSFEETEPEEPIEPSPVKATPRAKAKPAKPSSRQPSPKQPQSTRQEPEAATGPVERISIAHEFAPGSRIFLDLKNSNWKKRQGALLTVQHILASRHNCIKPNVGGEIIVALRSRLSDNNRNLATMAYDVVGQFVKAMGPGGVVHIKVIAPTILGQGCIDIKKTVRDAAMRCLTGCGEAFGLAPLIQYCPLPFASLNAVVRKGFLEWLVPRLQGQTGDFDAASDDLTPLVDPVMACLRDKTAEVRHLAEQCFERVIRSVGMGAVDAKVASITPAARLQLDPILKKYRNSESDATAGESSHATRAPGPTSATPRGARERPKSIAVPRTPAPRAGATLEEEATPMAGVRRPRPMSVRVTPSAAAAALTSSPDEVPKQKAAALLPNNDREARARRYMSRRLQFVEQLSFTDPSGSMPPLIGESIEDLADDLKDCCSLPLFTKLTAPANRFRMHIEAIETVTEELEDNPDTLGSVADVLLRWAACRLEDSKTPPTVLVKLAGFVSMMCEVLMSSGVKLGDYEASAILPPIIDKVGNNRETVRVAMQSAILSVGDVVDDENLIVLYSSCLRKPYSARSHSEVAKEICRLIDKRCSAGAGMPREVLPTIGRIAGGSDDSAGRAAASCLERAHEYFGDDLWNLVGDLTHAEAALLDDRLTSVINGMRHSLPSPSHGDYEIPEGEAAPPEPEGYYGPPMNPPGAATTAPTAPRAVPQPHDLRNEDFRLSVAPAPPKSVLQSISDSLTPATNQAAMPPPVPKELRQEPVPMPSNVQRFAAPQVDVGADVLRRLQSLDRDMQLSGLASIFEDLKGPGQLLQSRAGTQILLQLVRCFGQTLNRLERGNALPDDSAVLKSFLKGVIRFAREPELLQLLDQAAVEALLSDALNAMIPQKVDGVEDWDQVRRGVNLMIVKVLESCNQNLLFTAMINLLLSNIRNMQGSPSDKMPAMAKSSICIKSIAKVAKRGFANCRVNALLRDIHVFLKANPVRRDGLSSAEDQAFAMRLLKTIVNAVIEEIGVNIAQHLDLIVQPERSQLVQYIEMTLKDQGLDVEIASTFGSQSGAADAAGSEDERAVSERSADEVLGMKSDGESLSALLDRESENRDETNQEANDAYDSSKPELVSSRSTESVLTSSLSTEDATSLSSQRAGQVYLKRLHEIQLRYGLQSSKSVMEVQSKAGVAETVKQSAEDVKGKASSLRERMARIREQNGAQD